MNSDAICSCGSGKQSKFCCGKAAATVSMKTAFTWFIIGLLVSGIAVMAWLMPGDNDTPAANNSPATSIGATTVLGQGSIPSIANPTQGQYDPATDKHWHAVGNYWHDGPPPGSASSTNPLISQPLANQPDLGSSPSASPSILNPFPNQYDPVTDKYWHTTGNPHWHPGKPPNYPGQ